MRQAVLVLLTALGLLAAAPRPILAQEPMTFDTTELVIETQAGGSHRFTVELALSMRQRSRGLMFREELAPDAGMLFVYPQEQEIRMWMRNTLIPLDMIFVASDGRIVHIAEETVPLSEKVISSGGPARAVIEVGGGTARRLAIRPGDRVRHPLFDGG